jgi:hypothetical protein
MRQADERRMSVKDDDRIRFIFRDHRGFSRLVGDDISIFRDEAEWLEKRHPGFLEAWHVPYHD